MTTYTQQLEEFIQDVLITIHANIRDLEEKRTFADPEEHNYIDGRLFSYVEMLAILRASAREAGLNPPKYWPIAMLCLIRHGILPYTDDFQKVKWRLILYDFRLYTRHLGMLI